MTQATETSVRCVGQHVRDSATYCTLTARHEPDDNQRAARATQSTFLVRETTNDTGVAFAERLLQFTLLIALVATLISGWLVLEESFHIGAWINRSEPISVEALQALRRQVRWQFLASVSVCAVVIAAQGVAWWLRHKYIESQRALHQVRYLAHDVLASMDTGVITTDADGMVTSINWAAIQLLGADPESVGKSIDTLGAEALPLGEVYRQVVQAGTAVRGRDISLVRNGGTMQIRVSGHGLRGPENVNVGCVIYLEDVTERLLVEERMRRMERYLGLATLVSGLHHEIKNPLTALSIHVQLLEESLAKDGCRDELFEFTSVLKDEVARLNRVLESFRTLADLSRLCIQPTNMVDLLHDAMRLIGPQASRQGVECRIRVPAEDFPHVPVDPEKYKQALLNLIINALEAMPDGGQLDLMVMVKDGWFCTRISDTGPGICPEVQRYMFQPYFSTKPTGTGLGLALSEKLIGQHGGHISYQTGPGGTTFEIWVPLKPVHNVPWAREPFVS
jgi:two-component system sensor histidine kinase HydH